MLKSEKNGYRGIEYVLTPIPNGKWRWAIYPKKDMGLAKQSGETDGTRSEAEKDCRAAIDRALDAEEP